MEGKAEYKYLLLISGVFLACFYLPKRFQALNNTIALGVMPPALVVNGEVKGVGKVPSLEDMKKMLL